MKIFKSNPELRALASLRLDVVYSSPGGSPLTMHIIHPQDISLGARHPLIVFVQGSGWTKPNRLYEIPQLSAFARRGYVVATIDHRHASEAPGRLAFLEDTKSAIRFLRANAGEFGIDPAKVAIWGTSSGGNTALLTALTAGMPEFDTGENPGQSDAVGLVVAVFGPADLAGLISGRLPPREDYDRDSVFAHLAGGYPGDNMELFKRMSPQRYLRPGLSLPPFLILNGDADKIVTYESSYEFYERLIAAGYDAEFVKVEGGEHEGNFWSAELFDYIGAFIDIKLK